MKADAVSLLAIFEKKMRLEVPIYQRQYVWNQSRQWEPLWEDISGKFSEFLYGRKDAPFHFLGAMVLDQKQTPTTHVEKRLIIDGQQRLTTLQIFIAAFRDFCRLQNCSELADECESFIFNKGMMAQPEYEKFKVWPTHVDQIHFINVVSSGSKTVLEKKYPLIYPKYARIPEPRPRMIEAYIYFSNQISDYFIGNEINPPSMEKMQLSERLEECFQALKNGLQVVVIDLDQDDDAQVIFETLNARGEPLLPADLIRNYIFLRAARQNEDQINLYKEYWSHFDEPFWRKEVKQGRLFRPRSDLFFQHYLSSRQTFDIPIRHLFVEYKFWIDRQKPFATVREELSTLSRQGEDFRRIIAPDTNDPIKQLSTFLNTFDISTSYPLLLSFLDIKIPDEELQKISLTLESYLLRRAVCGLTTKNYNRIFLSLTKNLKRDGLTHENLVKQLMELTGESVEWPTDEVFKDAWISKFIYQILNNPKVVYILKRLNATFLGNKSESVTIEGPLSVEHLLPQNWLENWPLPDGNKGLTIFEMLDGDPHAPRVIATRTRNSTLQTMGNLTILTQALNSAVSNSAWSTKKVEIMKSSLLPINQELANITEWDEEAINTRGLELFNRAIKLWPRN